jgi:kinetochore protein NDC80
MSIGDVQRLQHDKVTMDENLQRIQDEKAAMEKELWDLEMATKNEIDELEEGVKAYQRRAETLKIVPASVKLADGVDLSIKFNRLAADVDDMVNKDLKHDIKPKLGDVKMKLVDKYHAVEDDRFAAEEKLHELTSAITDHRDAISQVSETLRSAEKSLEQEKELWTAKKRAVTKEVEGIDDRVHSLKTDDESALVESQRKVEAIHAEYQATKQRFEAEKEMMNEALLSLTFDLTDHRDYIQNNLQMMSEKAEGVLREVELEDEEGDDEDTGAYAE